MGEAHGDAALERLRDRFGVSVETVDLVVPLRETFGGKVTGLGRHVKQSGGHGQYAVCDIEVEPLPQGAGFEFAERVVGGSVPKNFIPSVEKGVRAQMERGVRNGYPVVDIRVDTDRRQGAQRRLLRHGLPERRCARAARGRQRGLDRAARALRRDRGRRARTRWSAP